MSTYARPGSVDEALELLSQAGAAVLAGGTDLAGQIDRGIRAPSLLVDLQDVGSRYYTFQATMLYCLEAAAANGLLAVVLDRPNPLGGVAVEGPTLRPRFESFVGPHPVATRHGLTLGELARLYRAERGLGLTEDEPGHGARGVLLLGLLGPPGFPRLGRLQTPGDADAGSGAEILAGQLLETLPGSLHHFQVGTL